MPSIREIAEKIARRGVPYSWLNDEDEYRSVLNWFANEIEQAIRNERECCAKDVCGYCAGHFPPYDAKPAGPNAAGNWIHLPKKNGKPTLCVANGIWTRVRFETATGKGD